ncbi:hypothetical protein T484DRAFT_1773808 [Baffinella frigidus]|nr:hypothetical protein T484DRAFT_1773808 [Cryptophyta sp. CCMP2293]
MDRQRLGQRLKFLGKVGVSLENQEAGIGRVEQERKRVALQALLQKQTVNLSDLRDAMVQGTLDSAKERVVPVNSVAWAFHYSQLKERRELIYLLAPKLLGRLRLRPAMPNGGVAGAPRPGSEEGDRDAEESETELVIQTATLVRNLVAKRLLDMDGHGADRLRPYEVMAWGAMAPVAATRSCGPAAQLLLADEFDLHSIARLFLLAAKATS